MRPHSLSITVAALLALGISTAHAATGTGKPTSKITNLDTQCQSLVKECFGYEGINRTTCFYSSATHPFCDGSELGSLAYQRWVMTPTGGNQAAPGLLGPQLIDQNCVAAFDSKLEGDLKRENVSTDSIRQLTRSLEECKRDIGIELQRP